MTEDEQDVLIFAMRYAMGRHTFAPITVAEVIGEHIRELGPRVRGVMVRDLANFAEEVGCDMREGMTAHWWGEHDLTVWDGLMEKLTKEES